MSPSSRVEHRSRGGCRRRGCSGCYAGGTRLALRLVKRIEICVDSIIQILLGQWVTMRVHGRARFLAPTNFMDLTVRQCSRMPGSAYRLGPFYALDIHKTLRILHVFL
ncbi:MAG: hypothetical protein OXC82_06645 [Rhodobacteraceae bacterium]|nr:hypothetical protein [Paracoccaceae bacterium]